MATWSFEPGHTSGVFSARHMMVTYVRGKIPDVHGTLDWDPAEPRKGRVHAVLDARKLDTGQPQRDAHLKSADFLDVEHHPLITYDGDEVTPATETEFRVDGNLTIRGTSRAVPLEVRYLGRWQTPWWEDGVDHGPKMRAGFVATARINRFDFGVAWQDAVPDGGVVVSPELDLTIDVEAVRE